MVNMMIVDIMMIMNVMMIVMIVMIMMMIVVNFVNNSNWFRREWHPFFDLHWCPDPFPYTHPNFSGVPLFHPSGFPGEFLFPETGIMERMMAVDVADTEIARRLVEFWER